MAQRSRFFDSTAGDRVYTADAWAEVIRALQTDGVVADYGSELAVAESNPPALSVVVALGAIFIQGRLLEIYAAPETLAIAAADVTNPRIDRVVARLDVTGRTALLAVKTGTPAASPSAPSLTRTASTWEISLARVAVAAGATSVLNASITDERSDPAVGGYGESHDVAALLDPTTGHDHDGTDSRGVAHSATTGRTANDHHNQAHGLGGADHTGTITDVQHGTRAILDAHHHAHLYGKGPDDHHAQEHAARHAPAGADDISGTYLPKSGGNLTGLLTTSSGIEPRLGDGGLPNAWAIQSYPEGLSVYYPNNQAGFPFPFGEVITLRNGDGGIQLNFHHRSTVDPQAALSTRVYNQGDGGWSAWERILTVPEAFRTAGGGDAGKQIWVGTTDPGGNAVEGDIWIVG